MTPPMSKKFAALPPTRATTSRLVMTKPAPLPITPMCPSSFTYANPKALAAFARCADGDDVGAVLEHFFGVKAAFAAGATLNENVGVFVNEDAHALASLTTAVAASIMVG